MPVKALPVFLKKITYVYRQLFNNKITEKKYTQLFPIISYSIGNQKINYYERSV